MDEKLRRLAIANICRRSSGGADPESARSSTIGGAHRQIVGAVVSAICREITPAGINTAQIDIAVAENRKRSAITFRRMARVSAIM